MKDNKSGWQFPKALEIIKCKEGNKEFMKERPARRPFGNTVLICEYPIDDTAAEEPNAKLITWRLAKRAARDFLRVSFMPSATSIANAVIALIAAIITAFVIPWIRSKTTAAQFEKIKMWVTVAVEAAEQLYTGSGRGAEKKAYVVEFLNSKGFKIDAETLDKLIEAAVFNLPDYFTISGIPADTDSNKE